MFSQFFISPLLKPECVDRELEAVESEFQLNSRSDSTRLQQLVADAASDGHPYRIFSWGNRSSLQKPDVHSALRTFYDAYYYASNMRLCIIGGYPLSVLERRVLSCFERVPAPPRSSPPPAAPPAALTTRQSRA